MYTIGIDLGGTNIVVGLCDENLKIIDSLKAKTQRHRPPIEIVGSMGELTNELLTKNAVSPSELTGVGIATPGIVDSENNIIEYSCNLPFRSFPLAEHFKNVCKVNDVRLINDANAAALAESLVGAAKGTRSSVTLTLGTGVGSGIIIDGKIFSGGIGYRGAEFGHVVIKAGGRKCACGRYGCIETYASANGLKNSTREYMETLKRRGLESNLFEIVEKSGRISARTPFISKRQGDKHGAILVERYIEYLSIGVANVINIFSPEVIVIGGGVSGEGDDLINPLTERVKEELKMANAPYFKIVAASLGSKSGIVGAAGIFN